MVHCESCWIVHARRSGWADFATRRGRSGDDASAGFVTVGADLGRRAEKEQRVLLQPRHYSLDYVLRSHQPRGRVADRALPLETSLTQPVVNEREVAAAVIGLLIFDVARRAISQHECPLASPLRNMGQTLSQMDGRVGIVADAEEQDGALELMNAPDRTVEPMHR